MDKSKAIEILMCQPLVYVSHESIYPGFFYGIDGEVWSNKGELVEDWKADSNHKAIREMPNDDKWEMYEEPEGIFIIQPTCGKSADELITNANNIMKKAINDGEINKHSYLINPEIDDTSVPTWESNMKRLELITGMMSSSNIFIITNDFNKDVMCQVEHTILHKFKKLHIHLDVNQNITFNPYRTTDMTMNESVVEEDDVTCHLIAKYNNNKEMFDAILDDIVNNRLRGIYVKGSTVTNIHFNPNKGELHYTYAK